MHILISAPETQCNTPNLDSPTAPQCNANNLDCVLGLIRRTRAKSALPHTRDECTAIHVCGSALYTLSGCALPHATSALPQTRVLDATSALQHARQVHCHTQRMAREPRQWGLCYHNEGYAMQGVIQIV